MKRLIGVVMALLVLCGLSFSDVGRVQIIDGKFYRLEDKGFLPFYPRGYHLVVGDAGLALGSYIDFPGWPARIKSDDMAERYSGQDDCIGYQLVDMGIGIFHTSIYSDLSGYIDNVLDYIAQNGGNVVSVSEDGILTEPFENDMNWYVLDNMADFMDRANDKNISVILRFPSGPGWVYQGVVDSWKAKNDKDCYPYYISFGDQEYYTDTDDDFENERCHHPKDFKNCLAQEIPDANPADCEDPEMADEEGWPNLQFLNPEVAQKRGEHIARVIAGIQKDKYGNPRPKSNLFAIQILNEPAFIPHLSCLPGWQGLERALVIGYIDLLVNTVKTHPAFVEVEEDNPPLLFTMGVNRLAPDEVENPSTCGQQALCFWEAKHGLDYTYSSDYQPAFTYSNLKYSDLDYFPIHYGYPCLGLDVPGSEGGLRSDFQFWLESNGLPPQINEGIVMLKPVVIEEFSALREIGDVRESLFRHGTDIICPQNELDNWFHWRSVNKKKCWDKCTYDIPTNYPQCQISTETSVCHWWQHTHTSAARFTFYLSKYATERFPCPGGIGTCRLPVNGLIFWQLDVGPVLGPASHMWGNYVWTSDGSYPPPPGEWPARLYDSCLGNVIKIAFTEFAEGIHNYDSFDDLLQAGQCVLWPDEDGDQIPDDNNRDNCVGTFNPAQVDTDGDGKGDLCETSCSIITGSNDLSIPLYILLIAVLVLVTKGGRKK